MLILHALFILACRPRTPATLEGFGLKTANLRTEHGALAALYAAGWEKKLVAADLEIDGLSFPSQAKLAGRSTIDAFKKSFHIIFPHANQSYAGRKTLRFSAQYADRSGIRTLIGLEIFRGAGLLVPEAEPVAFYINETYQGLYLQIEPVDRDFLLARHTSAYRLIKCLMGNASFRRSMLPKISTAFNVEIGDESLADMELLVDLLERDISGATNRDIEAIIDVENYLSYLAASVMTNNFDGYQNNLHLFQTAAGAAFRFIPWDLDRIWENDATSKSEVSIYGGNGISARLIKVPAWRRLYLKKLSALLDLFPAKRITDLIDENASLVAKAYEHDRIMMMSNKSQSSVTEELKKVASAWRDQVADVVKVELKTLESKQ